MPPTVRSSPGGCGLQANQPPGCRSGGSEGGDTPAQGSMRQVQQPRRQQAGHLVLVEVVLVVLVVVLWREKAVAPLGAASLTRLGDRGQLRSSQLAARTHGLLLCHCHAHLAADETVERVRRRDEKKNKKTRETRRRAPNRGLRGLASCRSLPSASSSAQAYDVDHARPAFDSLFAGSEATDGP